MTYLIRVHNLDGEHKLLTAGEVQARYADLLRTKRILAGTFREVEKVGVQPTQLVLFSPDAKYASGTKAGGSLSRAYCATNSASVREVLRRLRDDDEAALAEADARVAHQVEMLNEARDLRRALVQAAWRRARPVMVGDLIDQAKQHEADLQARRTDTT